MNKKKEPLTKAERHAKLLARKTFPASHDKHASKEKDEVASDETKSDDSKKD